MYQYHSSEMNTNIAIQYTAVAIIIIAALVWLVIKFVKRSRKASKDGCCGCALSEKCSRTEKSDCP